MNFHNCSLDKSVAFVLKSVILLSSVSIFQMILNNERPVITIEYKKIVIQNYKKIYLYQSLDHFACLLKLISLLQHDSKIKILSNCIVTPIIILWTGLSTKQTGKKIMQPVTNVKNFQWLCHNINKWYQTKYY